ncbi:tRNA (guanosine(46)-N7)-methyltransferase TrmB [Mesosutterella sp. AGMB02718]|uniref:tRNA (guanine-N(7)-)-methyltransferase n=1 Tax=Mesosutterella faecium TaxID=2925194 RepID=A0ABT7ILY2_9BURK|nr:tRNA (guanosine(46)-N7)-methyltransferase TrmB [Mesosutterella sp. AGMB02718]MDL2059010.1 tRNA (guanosine(46)-N7)-methyltransferase TrmB [Mesosutterella sp. AGMB02718]
MSTDLTPEQLEELKKRHIRSFSMRRGHISNAQRRSLDELFPLYEVAYEERPADFETIFGRKAPLVFEIGCGMGETTAAIAQAHPEINFLGCEVFPPGVGALAKRLSEMSLTNVRIIRHDAVDVVEKMIPEDSLAGVHIFFPDPWRKARHHKRRLVAQPFISKLCSRIAPGGYLHCATDWENYAEQMLDVLSHEPALQDWKGCGYCPVMANPLCERPSTKFQQRGERLGHGIWDLVYIRRP